MGVGDFHWRLGVVSMLELLLLQELSSLIGWSWFLWFYICFALMLLSFFLTPPWVCFKLREISEGPCKIGKLELLLRLGFFPELAVSPFNFLIFLRSCLRFLCLNKICFVFRVTISNSWPTINDMFKTNYKPTIASNPIPYKNLS